MLCRNFYFVNRATNAVWIVNFFCECTHTHIYIYKIFSSHASPLLPYASNTATATLWLLLVLLILFMLCTGNGLRLQVWKMNLQWDGLCGQKEVQGNKKNPIQFNRCRDEEAGRKTTFSYSFRCNNPNAEINSRHHIAHTGQHTAIIS